MKIKLALMAAVAAMALAGVAEAKNLPCNPAVQNWQNGSQNTCPMWGAGNGLKKHVPQLKPRKMEEPDEEEDNTSEAVTSDTATLY